MKQSDRATRNLVSKALYYALRNSEQDFNEAMNSNESNILSALVTPVMSYAEEYIEKYNHEIEEPFSVNDFERGYYESETFRDALTEELSSALYDARQAAREAFLKYFQMKADTDSMAADLVNHLSD